MQEVQSQLRVEVHPVGDNRLLHVEGQLLGPDFRQSLGPELTET